MRDPHILPRSPESMRACYWSGVGREPHVPKIIGEKATKQGLGTAKTMQTQLAGTCVGSSLVLWVRVTWVVDRFLPVLLCYCVVVFWAVVEAEGIVFETRLLLASRIACMLAMHPVFFAVGQDPILLGIIRVAPRRVVADQLVHRWTALALRIARRAGPSLALGITKLSND